MGESRINLHGTSRKPTCFHRCESICYKELGNVHIQGTIKACETREFGHVPFRDGFKAKKIINDEANAYDLSDPSFDDFQNVQIELKPRFIRDMYVHLYLLAP